MIHCEPTLHPTVYRLVLIAAHNMVPQHYKVVDSLLTLRSHLYSTALSLCFMHLVIFACLLCYMALVFNCVYGR